MLIGHIYPRLTSVRSPLFKREAFEKVFMQLRTTTFEGFQPSRRELREMAWLKAGKMAQEQRAIQMPPMVIGESRILRPGGLIMKPRSIGESTDAATF